MYSIIRSFASDSVLVVKVMPPVDEGSTVPSMSMMSVCWSSMPTSTVPFTVTVPVVVMVCVPPCMVSGIGVPPRALLIAPATAVNQSLPVP